MLSQEKERADGIEALAIITPNDSHTGLCKAVFAAGLDVMVEKPLCNDLAEARANLPRWRAKAASRSR